MPYWKRIEFWQKVRESFLFFGTVGTGSISGANASDIANIPDKWITLTAFVAISGAVVSHFTKTWFEDKDGDGYVDLFQNKKRTGL